MADKPPDPPGGLASELARLDRAIAEMAATNVQLDRERRDIAGKMQLAQYRRDVLAHEIAVRQRRRGGGRPGAGRDRSRDPAGPAAAPPPRTPSAPAEPPPSSARSTGSPDRSPAGPPGAARVVKSGQPAQPAQPARPTPGRPRVEVAPLPPEASSRSVQTIMLGLGALLLGIAAIVFVAVAITELEPGSQLVILLAVTGLFLGFGPPVAARGLTATAETLAATGLLLFSVASYPLWNMVAASGIPGTVYGGLVAAGTAGIGYGYHLITRLDVPRWAALLAAQPVLPLLAAPLVPGATGWAVVFALVAAFDAGAAMAAGRRLLGYLAWGLHGSALLVAIGAALAGLFLSSTPPAAVLAGLSLVLATGVGLAGALGLGRQPLPELAAGLLTLAVIGSGWRVVALALPGRALLPAAAIVTAAALSCLLLPRPARRGPQRASAWALAALGVLVAALAVRAGAAALVWPPWPAELSGYRAGLAGAVGTLEWQLAVTAAAATVGAGLAMPQAWRREVTVAGTALTALAAPASFGLVPAVGAWVLAVAAAGLSLTGLDARTPRAAASHVAGAGLVFLVAAGASLAEPALTATVLAAITVTGAVVAGARPRIDAVRARPGSAPAGGEPAPLDPAVADAGELVAGWAAGAATLTLPLAATTGAVAAGYGPGQVLAAGFAAACGSLGYAALTQLRHRHTPLPVRLGAALGTAAVAGVALSTAPTNADLAIAGLLLLATGMVVATPRIDAIRRPDRSLDGADLAAAVVTGAVVATLARIASLTLPVSGPDAALATAAGLVLVVAIAVRAVPRPWRRGPALGVAVSGALIGAVAAAAALVSGAQMLAATAPVWRADLAGLPPDPAVAGLSWAGPFALVVLAVTAAVVLPYPNRARASAALVVLATIGTPAGLGLPWWTPAALSLAVGTGYALASVGLGPRAAPARALAAGALLAYAVGASLGRAWATAAVLGLIVVVGTAVAAVAAVAAAGSGEPAGADEPPGPGDRGGASAPGRWLPAAQLAADPRRIIGGTAVAAVLLAVPAMLAAAAGQLGHPTGTGLLAALGGVSIGLAAVAAVAGWAARAGGHRSLFAPYLPYGTVGIAAGATVVALASAPTGHPTGMYAAAAGLLAVLAELVRSASGGAGPDPAGQPAWPGPRPRISPPVGALIGAAVPALITLIAITPALAAALLDPYQVLAAPWEGPPAALVRTDAVPATSVLAALLLTLAAALAAAGFGGTVTRQAAPVVAPGLAVTALITPAAFGLPWPAGTAAALAVFTMAMLGVALTPPPPPTRAARPVRATRLVVLGIGLAAGGAGLAGSLADPGLTWATFGGAVAVGATAALGGRSGSGRLLGWSGAVAAAQLFALVTAYLLDADRHQFGFALLTVGAVALLAVARLPRLGRPAAARELAAVEGLGGYMSLLVAVLLAADSPPDLAAVLIGTGAVLGLAAVRPGRSHRQRRILWVTGAVSEVLAWWTIMFQLEVGLLEAYTLPFALFALLVGALEVRYRPELGSWLTYGPGLVAAFAPSLLLVVTTTDPAPGRQVWVILGGVATLLLGSRLGQRAPLIIGSVVTALAALHLLSLAGPWGLWLLLIPIGVLLLVLGANREKRQRDLQRLRGAYSRMR